MSQIPFFLWDGARARCREVLGARILGPLERRRRPTTGSWGRCPLWGARRRTTRCRDCGCGWWLLRPRISFAGAPTRYSGPRCWAVPPSLGWVQLLWSTALSRGSASLLAGCGGDPPGTGHLLPWLRRARYSGPRCPGVPPSPSGGSATSGPRHSTDGAGRAAGWGGCVHGRAHARGLRGLVREPGWCGAGPAGTTGPCPSIPCWYPRQALLNLLPCDRCPAVNACSYYSVGRELGPNPCVLYDRRGRQR